MKKPLFNYIQLVSTRMSRLRSFVNITSLLPLSAIRSRLAQLKQNRAELLSSHPFNAMGLKVVNTLSVISVFMVVALMVNAPLRAELVKSLGANLQDGQDTGAELASLDRETPVMEKVSFVDPTGLGFQSLYSLPESNKSSVPSIAPLADRIPLSQIDPQATDMKLLSALEDQLRVADFMASKYRTDPFKVRDYIAQTMQVAREVNLDPVLLIAVMAIESNFNPNAQSPAGAQGLMQVMTRVHLNKFAPYGGASAAFKPEANIRVGAYILKYYIAQAGSLNGGLRYYVGGPAVSADGGYVGKVLRERELLIGMLKGGSTTASVKSANDI